MLSFSRKSDYALIALAELASRDGERCSASCLAEATEAPDSLLRNILKDLTRSGILVSERGPFGGYALARDPDRICVLEVVEAVDGPIALARCCASGETPERDGCVHSPRCRIQHGIRMMHEGVLGVLRGVSVADLLDEDETGVVALRVDALAGSETGGSAAPKPDRETHAAQTHGGH